MYIEYLNNEEIMKELGRRIKDTRIAFNYTQTELAQRAVISKSTISRAEKGENISLEQLIIILRELRLLKNLELLIPKQELTPEEIFDNKKKRQRVKSKQIKTKWVWGEDKWSV